MINPKLEGRVALVTGANTGIGAAIGRLLAEQGVHVFATYLRQPPGDDPGKPDGFYQLRARSADWLIDEIANAGGEAVCSEADLTDPAVVPRLFDEAEASFGRVEILVNNAAYAAVDSFSGAGPSFG